MWKVGSLGRLSRVAVLVGLTAVLVGVPLAASANPDVSGFELDGNAASGGAADWNALGSPLDFTGFIDDGTGDSDIGYGSGSNKDIDDVSAWSWKQDDVTPNKDDIVSAYAAAYAEQNNLILYFGQTRLLDKNGDANVGFWFLQNEVALNANGSFSGSHADGDILVQSEFTNGGSVSGVKIFKWQGGSLTPVSNQAECVGGKLGTVDACAIVNTGTISTDWAGDVTAPYFFEGGPQPDRTLPSGRSVLQHVPDEHAHLAVRDRRAQGLRVRRHRHVRLDHDQEGHDAERRRAVLVHDDGSGSLGLRAQRWWREAVHEAAAGCVLGDRERPAERVVARQHRLHRERARDERFHAPVRRRTSRSGSSATPCAPTRTSASRC